MNGDISLYSANGMECLGTLGPSSCTVKEAINGALELSMDHPVDDADVWAMINNDLIVEVDLPTRAPVPVTYNGFRRVFTTAGRVTGAEIAVAIGDRYVLKTLGTAGIVPAFALNERVYECGYVALLPVVTTEDLKGDGIVEKCVCAYRPADGKFYWFAERTASIPARSNVQTDDAAAIAAAPTSYAFPARERFRIHTTTVRDDGVSISARHLYYDVDDGEVVQLKATGATRRQLAQGTTLGWHALLASPGDSEDNLSTGFYTMAGYGVASCFSPHVFDTPIAALQTQDMRGAEWDETDSSMVHVSTSLSNKKPVDAMIGTDGYCNTYGVEILRHMREVYMYAALGGVSPLRLADDVNIEGIEITEDIDDVITYVIPVGKTSTGADLYLNGERGVQSSRWAAYNLRKCKRIEVDGATVSANLTTAGARALMLTAAQAELAKGCDIPKVMVDISLCLLRNTVAYHADAALAALENVYLGDQVTVHLQRLNIDITIRITEYEYDCLMQRYNSFRMGTVDTLGAVRSVAARTTGNTGTTVGDTYDMQELTDAEVGAILVWE